MRKPTLLLAALLGAAAPVASAESLLQFYDAALRSNPDYLIREFGVDQARAQRDIATSRLLPQVSVSANYSRNNFNDDFNADRYSGLRAAVQVRQALVDLASYFRLQGARANVLQSKHLRAAARMAVGGEVIDRYLLVLQTADEVQYLDAEKQATRSEIARLRLMRERQLVKVTDLLEVEAYYQELLTNEIQARADNQVALEQLRETSGLDAREAAPLARTDFDPIEGDADAWVASAAENNGTLIALQHGISAARSLLRSTRSEHLPQVAIIGSQVNSDQGVDNRQSPEFDVGSIGVQVTIPLYEGGRVSGSVEEARARWEIARQQYEQAWRQVARETRTAWLAASASHARVGSSGEEVRALERVVDAQRKSYQLGVSTIVDVLVAQRRLLRARFDQSRARYDFIRALATLKVRAGNLGDGDVLRIDSWMRNTPLDGSTPDGNPVDGGPGDGGVPATPQATRSARHRRSGRSRSCRQRRQAR
jgi:outer membrane protein